MKKTLSATLLMLLCAAVLFAQSEFSPESMLKPKASGLYTTAPNLTVREAYDALGAKAGFNMVYTPDFKQDPFVPFRIEGQDFFDAMKRLSEETKTFWFAWDNKTIVLAPDTLQNRRDLEPNTFKIVYLPNATPQQFTDISTAARARQLRGFYASDPHKAVALFGTPPSIAAAEQLISEITKESLPLRASAPVAIPENGTIFELASENGKTRRVVPANRTYLENTLSEVSVDMNQPAPMVYEDLITRAGLNVIFDRSMTAKPAGRFHVEGVSFVNALDLLALQTGTFWIPISESVFYVTDDNQQNRRDREQFTAKVIYFPERTPDIRVNDAMNVLRTSLSIRGIFQFMSDERKAAVIKDTPLRVALVEKVIADLVKDLGKPTSVVVTTDTSSYYAENGWVFGFAKEARSKMEIKLRGKTTVRLKETPKVAFEKLAELAGVEVVFDKAFSDGPENPFNATNVDVLDAFDLLAWQTRTFLTVVDQHTIRVTRDTQQTRRDQQPMVEKTIVPSNITNTNLLLNVLRTTLSLRTVSVDPKNNILIRDIADNVALAEKLVEILGKGASQ
jgi:hypothetical protein